MLDKLHFPGIAPIKRAKEIIKQDPDFADNYFSLVYENEDFAGGYWIGNNLYFWFYPKYGFHFGGLYSLDLNSGKLTSFHPKFDKLIGINNKGEIAYTLLKDEDAAEVYKAIYIKTKRRTFTVPGVELSAGAAFFHDLSADDGVGAALAAPHAVKNINPKNSSADFIYIIIL